LAYVQNLVKVTAGPEVIPPDIVAVEYYIDTDPGFGNGIQVAISGEPIIDFTFEADVSGVSAGDHDLYLRVKDENNRWSVINIFPFIISEVELTAFMEGPYNGTDMNTNINSAGQIPLSQPFNVSPWNYTGSESVVSIPNSNIVDWILLETRNADDASLATGETISSRSAAFILNDGTIVGLDGTSNLQFNAHTDTNNFVIIRHRNHLGVLSNQELDYTGGIFNYNFSTGLGQAYGSGQKDLGGAYGMTGGNANSDSTIDEFDLSEKWDLEAGSSGYFNSDLNMDSQADNVDKNDVWLINQGNNTTIPE